MADRRDPLRADDDLRKGRTLTVAAKTARGLREAMVEFGIRQMADFVNVNILVGVLVGNNAPGKSAGDLTFSEMFEKYREEIVSRLEGGELAEDLRAIATHSLGEAAEMNVDRLLFAGLTAEKVVIDTQAHAELTRNEVVYAMVAVVLMSAFAGASADRREEALEAVRRAVEEKAGNWEQAFPADDEWMEE